MIPPVLKVTKPFSSQFKPLQSEWPFKKYNIQSIPTRKLLFRSTWLIQFKTAKLKWTCITNGTSATSALFILVLINNQSEVFSTPVQPIRGSSQGKQLKASQTKMSSNPSTNQNLTLLKKWHPRRPSRSHSEAEVLKARLELTKWLWETLILEPIRCSLKITPLVWSRSRLCFLDLLTQLLALHTHRWLKMAWLLSLIIWFRMKYCTTIMETRKTFLLSTCQQTNRISQSWCLVAGINTGSFRVKTLFGTMLSTSFSGHWNLTTLKSAINLWDSAMIETAEWLQTRELLNFACQTGLIKNG